MNIVIAYAGYIFLTDMAVGLEVGKLLEDELRNRQLNNVYLIDVSTDVLTAVDLINEKKPDIVILTGAKRRGRPKGTIEVINVDLKPPTNAIDANDLLRPSLDGRICITDVAEGLRVLGTTAKEVILIECEPPNDNPGIEISNEGKECAIKMKNKILEILNKYLPYM